MPNAKTDFKNVITGFNTQTTEINKSRRKSCGWIFWIFIFIFTIVMFLYQLTDDFKRYREKPISASIWQQFHENLEFPNITVCVREPVENKIFSKLDREIGDHEMGYFSSALTYYAPSLDPYEHRNYTELDTITGKWMNAENITGMEDHLLKNTEMTKENMFGGCSIRGITRNCSDFIGNSGYYETDFCFYSSKTMNQSAPGYRGALQMKLSTKVLAASGMSWQRPYGWRIWFTPSYGNTGATSPVSVMNGAVMNIKLKKWTKSRVSKCVQHPTPLLQCLHECEANATVKECGCVRIGIDERARRGRAQCRPGSEGFCAYNASKFLSNCTCDQLACNTVEFEAEAAVINPSRTDNDTETVVNLYYESLSTMVYQEYYVVSLSSMLGTVGGQASLWLGIRFANVVQVLYYAGRALNNRRRPRELSMV